MEPDDPPSCIIYVDDDNTNGPWRGTPEHPYQYIQDAVDIAADDDTVLVRNGTYYENLLIYRTINLIGEQKNSTVINGGGNDDVIYIIARNVTVSGFTIQNSGSFWSCNGIEVHADHSFIYENNIVQNRGGITLESCYNIVSDNIVGDIFYDLFGILIRFSSHNIVINNDITGSGISQFVSFFNIISENTVENGAIYFEGASVNIISGNTVKNSMWGIAVVDTMKNTIIDNTLTSTGIWILSPRFIDGWNTHIIENNTANGKPIRYYKNSDDINIPSNTSQVILANCTNIIIQDCNFSDVNIGIQLGFSSNITIRRNIISGNSYSGIVAEVLSHSIVNENIVEDNNRCGIQLISSFRTFDLFVTHANNIINNTIENHNYGLTLSGINNKVCRNTFSYNIEGIALSGEETNNNTIAENIINNNSGDGISLRWFSNNNTVIWNNITYNDGRGIYLWRSLDNSIHHNNIIGNNQNAYESECSEYFNAWDDEISEGNYWDDFPLNPGYPEVYEIPPDGNNVDNYPLENPI